AHDFLRRIAFQALGSGIPGHHVAIRIQHENGVVADSIHQHAVELLAVAESLLRDAALAQVAGHLGEAAQHTGFVAYRRDHHVRPEPAAALPDAPALVLEP